MGSFQSQKRRKIIFTMIIIIIFIINIIIQLNMFLIYFMKKILTNYLLLKLFYLSKYYLTNLLNGDWGLCCWLTITKKSREEKYNEKYEENIAKDNIDILSLLIKGVKSSVVS